MSCMSMPMESSHAVIGGHEGSLIDRMYGVNEIRQNIIPAEVVLPKLNASTYFDALELMVANMADHGYVSSPSSCLDDLLSREKKITSCHDDRFALPHCKSSSCKRLITSIARCSLDDDSSRKQKLIVLTISPLGETGLYLRHLSSLATFLFQEADLDSLLRLDDADQIRDVFLTC
jgi:mannitol/fructose-specific phosphotransferase system IIA component (Ntr-type)